LEDRDNKILFKEAKVSIILNRIINFSRNNVILQLENYIEYFLRNRIYRRDRSSSLSRRGGRAAGLGGAGCFTGHRERLQQPALGEDTRGPGISPDTSLPSECGPRVSSGPVHHVHRPRGSAEIRLRTAPLGPRVRRGAQDADAAGLGADVLCR
jgi:hypothetical protein